MLYCILTQETDSTNAPFKCSFCHEVAFGRPWRIYGLGGKITEQSKLLIYGLAQLGDVLYEDDKLCKLCRNKLLTFSKSHQKMTDALDEVLNRRGRVSVKRPMSNTPVMSPLKSSPVKKKMRSLQSTNNSSPMLQVILFFLFLTIMMKIFYFALGIRHLRRSNIPIQEHHQKPRATSFKISTYQNNQNDVIPSSKTVINGQTQTLHLL